MKPLNPNEKAAGWVAKSSDGGETMSKVMMTIQSGGTPPTIADIRRRYSLDDDDIDTDFGVVEVDPAEHVYTFLVEEKAASKISVDSDWSVEGPYSNPRIEPFGPPE